MLRWFGFFILALTASALAVSLFQWQSTLAWLGELLVCSDRPEHADLVLVLGGDFWGPRVLLGAELGTKRYAPLVLISGPPYGGRPEGQLAVDFLVDRGYPRSLFEVFGHHEGSTVGEAIMLRGELARRGVKRVIVVTSNYHSRRAKIVLSLFCPGVKFDSVPAPDSHYDPRIWWKDPAMRDLFAGEVVKIAGSIFFAYPRHLLASLWSRALGSSAPGTR